MVGGVVGEVAEGARGVQLEECVGWWERWLKVRGEFSWRSVWVVGGVVGEVAEGARGVQLEECVGWWEESWERWLKVRGEFSWRSVWDEEKNE